MFFNALWGTQGTLRSDEENGQTMMESMVLALPKVKEGGVRSALLCWQWSKEGGDCASKSWNLMAKCRWHSPSEFQSVKKFWPVRFKPGSGSSGKILKIDVSAICSEPLAAIVAESRLLMHCGHVRAQRTCFDTGFLRSTMKFLLWDRGKVKERFCSSWRRLGKTEGGNISNEPICVTPFPIQIQEGGDVQPNWERASAVL